MIEPMNKLTATNSKTVTQILSFELFARDIKTDDPVIVISRYQTILFTDFESFTFEKLYSEPIKA